MVTTMSVTVKSVSQNSPARKSGIQSGDILTKINNNEIMDVLDYRFYQDSEKCTIEYINAAGKVKKAKIRKKEYEELGLEFETYLMDKKHSCRNKCMFCFIDQLPGGMRDSLYFKDDDSRLSFLFGNYITLTNITEHEIARIIKMHISPINISVHTTNPELRVRMMKNKNAGKALEIMKRFNAAGIRLNCQLVLVPGVNDGEELQRTLDDLLMLEDAECVAAVPVGLTRYREGLEELQSFDEKTAAAAIQTIEDYGTMSVCRYGERRFFAADEFYILAGKELPDASYYGDFLQLENGVGLVPLLLDESDQAIKECEETLDHPRKITLLTGEAAYPFLCGIVDKVTQKWDNLECRVIAVKNNYFGGKITVAGLVTATDILDQTKGIDLGQEVLIPSVMLRDAGDLFLDSISLAELSEKLGVPVTPVNNDGAELLESLLGTRK